MGMNSPTCSPSSTAINEPTRENESCASPLKLLACLDAAACHDRDSRRMGLTYEDILRGFDDPERWLTYSGDYSGRRHSPLTRITPENVGELRPIWTFQTGTTTRGRGFEATPLVDDGVLYVTASTWRSRSRSASATRCSTAATGGGSADAGFRSVIPRVSMGMGYRFDICRGL